MSFQATTMKISDLADNTGEWLRGTGPESDIVISSRIRLARNVARFPFLSRANVKQKKELEETIRDRIKGADISHDLCYLNLADITPVDRLFLVERHLISREHAGGEGERAGEPPGAADSYQGATPRSWLRAQKSDSRMEASTSDCRVCSTTNLLQAAQSDPQSSL